VRKRSLKRRALQPLVNYLAYFGARMVLAILERTPYRAARFAGMMAGRAGFLLGRRDRRRMLAHLAIAFPERPSVERMGIARRCMENLGISAALAPVFYSMDLPTMRRYVANYDEVLTHLTGILQRGKGLIALSGHLGNWESSGSIISRSAAHPLNVVGNRLPFEPFNRLLARMRRNAHFKVILLSETSWDILRSLKRNEIVAILADQDIRFLPGVFVDFFGLSAFTPIGPVFVARISKAPLVPFFLVHEGRGFRFVWSGEIPLARTDDLDRDLLENTRRWSSVMEDFIRRYPDQWAWNHRRWKTRPGDPKAGKTRKSPQSA
jgi:KDO2-lipid IV(A) lauroyltransferase